MIKCNLCNKVLDDSGLACIKPEGMRCAACRQAEGKLAVPYGDVVGSSTSHFKLKLRSRIEKIIYVAGLIAKVYEDHSAGGGLHIVLDDGNTEDEHLDFCIQYITRPEYKDEASGDQIRAEKDCISCLRLMDEKDRRCAINATTT